MRAAIAAAYLSAIRRAQPLRRAALIALLALALPVLAPPAGAGASGFFYIRGGGNGHGIGMSQYGAEGYALHGRGYRWILRHYYRGTALGRIDPRRTVRVLVADGAASVSGANRIGGVRVKPALSYAVRPNADGTLVVRKPSGKKLGTFPAPLTATGRGPLTLAGIGSYRGSLEFRPGPGSAVQTVDVVDVEDYVRGVISAEVPASWAPAALEAQAVAARTYALTSDAGGGVFDVYADTRSQMYRGVAAETPATDAAVAATRGRVVTYGGTPVVTYFFSSSGGHTENVENVWPGSTPEPWLRGVVDRYDGAAGDPYHLWGRTLTPTAAAAKLGGWVKGKLIGIRITAHGVSPRILTAEVIGTRGNSRVSGAQLQRAFGLLTTYASFTTITTLPGHAPAGAARTARGAAPARGVAQSQAIVALVPLVDDLLSGAAALHGEVFPAPGRARIEVQRLAGRHGWRTVLRSRLGAGGAFDTGLPGPGSYRVVYRGLAGPAVTVS